MGSFATWWERLSRREWKPPLVAAFALGITVSQAGHIVKFLALPAGSYWS